jgi:protein-tyrosine phosphatase
VSAPGRPSLRLLFVCLGNICRSPSAEAVMRAKVRQAGLEEQIEIDSAGTGDWHVGEAADPRARSAAGARGFALDSRARQVEPRDFEEFDLILAMDRANLHALHRLSPPPPTRAELRLLREFDPDKPVAGERDGRSGPRDTPAGRRVSQDPLEVPDPYYGGTDGFEEVLDLLEASCEGLLEELRSRLSAVAREDGDMRAPEVRG